MHVGSFVHGEVAFTLITQIKSRKFLYRARLSEPGCGTDGKYATATLHAFSPVYTWGRELNRDYMYVPEGIRHGRTEFTKI